MDSKPSIRTLITLISCILVNQYLRLNLRYKKYQLFKVTFKVSLFQFFHNFDWYNSHYQRLYVEWKFKFCFKFTIKWNLKNSHATRLKSTKYKTHVIKEHLLKWMSYKRMNQYYGLSYGKTLFLSHQKVPNEKIACSYSKEVDLY